MSNQASNRGGDLRREIADVWLRRVKFRRVPSCMHSTVSCAHPSQGALAMGSRMLSTVTAPSAG